MKSLELSVQDLRDSHPAQVNKQPRQFLDLLRRGDRTKFELTSEITSAKQVLLDEVHRSSSEINSSLASFGSQLANIVTHIMKASDAKKGKSSGGGRKGRRWF
ncbi:putative acyl-activating enzyme 5, peroxisomal [Dorcoceras hygrometricum]|uniref:Putative acyl-activating enzyme 5, peroxisomal n=1 Tax=Dorcoceras hygrometricum TaxID=472368 RepID=A0A2Z7D038_9LAMI|nr:putative acyl-activating enzyme 5, peroxisomal [Dorcoceras hygrometricum]